MKKQPSSSQVKKSTKKIVTTAQSKVAATKNEVKAAGDKVMKKYKQAIKGLAKRREALRFMPIKS